MINDVVFPDSRVTWDGETYFTARLGGVDHILVLFSQGAGSGRRGALTGVETTTTIDGAEFGLKVCPATYENMLALDRQVAPARRLVALNKEANLWRGLGTGNRVIITLDDGPILGDPATLGVFPGIFRATVARGIPTWFIQQSIVRELIPEGVDPAQYPGIGHTGGYGPRELLRAGLFAFASLGGYRADRMVIGADADHAIITGTNEEELAASLEFNKLAMAEAKDYTKFTVDVSRLFHFPVSLSDADENRLMKVFRGRRWTIPNILPDQPPLEYAFGEEEIIHLAHKYWRAGQVHKELYDFVVQLKRGEPFDYELSLDETPRPDDAKELLFYMVLLEEVMGIPRKGVASAAPNLGFYKRADYQGNIETELKPLANAAASILAHFGAVLCVHSGSGEGVTTGKGPGVDQALREATGGHLELKVSGIFQEILWRVLAESPRSEDRALFEKVWDETKRVVEILSAVYTELIAGRPQAEAEVLITDEKRLGEIGKRFGVGSEAVNLVQAVLKYGLGQAKLAHELLATADPAHKRPSDDFFRHFAYLVFRPLRAEILGTISAETWARYDEAVSAYASMRVRDLGLER